MGRTAGTNESPQGVDPRGVRLTPRQRQVLDLLVHGRTNAEIGEALGISLDGAKWHVREVMSTLGVSSRERAAEWWVEYNRVPARMGRLVGGLVPGAIGGWVAATAAGVAVGGLVIAAYAALANGSSGPAAPEQPPSAVPTPSPDTGKPGVPTPTPATGKQGVPTPTPMNIPPPRATPPGGDPAALASAPLVVYTDEVGSVSRGDRSWPIVEVVSYDLAARRIVGAFRIGTTTEFARAPSVTLVGRTVLASLEQRIIAANLDGSGLRTVYAPPSGGVVTSFAVAPDGRALAVGVEGIDIADSGLAFLVFVDLATGTELGRIDHAAFAAAGSRGSALGVRRWWANGDAVEVSAGYHKGARPETVTAHRDGRVEAHANWRAVVDPEGRLAADSAGPFAPNCGGMVEAQTELRIVDLVAGRELAKIVVDGLGLRAFRWSTDGRELLVGSYGPSSDCVKVDRWYAWSSSDGLRPVPDLEALLKRWDGEHYVSLVCKGEPLPVEYPVNTSGLTCDSMVNPAPATLLVGGMAIDTIRRGSLAGFTD